MPTLFVQWMTTWIGAHSALYVKCIWILINIIATYAIFLRSVQGQSRHHCVLEVDTAEDEAEAAEAETAPPSELGLDIDAASSLS